MTAAFLCLLTLVSGLETSPLTRPPNHGGVYVVAHRGVHEGIPENTLAAYRRAMELGADFVEIDLRETKDGHLISVHNHTIDDYTSDASGPVTNFTLAELKALDIGSRVGTEWADERIPTFEEILALCKGNIGIYLDLKQGDVDKVLALVRRYEMERDIVWYAGTPNLRRLRALCPECLIMPDPGAEENLPRTLAMFQPNVIASSWKQLSASFVKACHAANAIIIVDDAGPDTWDTMLSWGVDGIQTDHVAALIERLTSVKAP